MTDLDFPSETQAWQTVSAAEAGWSHDGLQTTLEVAQGELSTGLVVLWRGRILAEGYWKLADELPEVAPGALEIFRAMQLGANDAGHPIEDVASTQKSVTALLTLMAARRGLLQIDDAVTKYLGSGWSKAPADREAGITIRHLLEMTSGLGENLEYLTTPDETWYYNNAAYHRLMPLLEAVSGESINELTRSWLTAPLGMNDTRWIDRKFIHPGAPLGLATTARDLARFGLLVLAQGRWAEQGQLVEADNIAELIHPAQKLNPSYGLLWWLNGQPHFTRPLESEPSAGPLFHSAPADLVAAMGTFQRRVYVVPSLDLVVARMGYTKSISFGPFDEALWTALGAASASHS
jgi:CubicO group peptidase (beta-lactamase class C family)